MTHHSELTIEDLLAYLDFLAGESIYYSPPMIVHPDSLHFMAQRGFLGSGRTCDVPECWFYANHWWPDGTFICIYHGGVPYKDIIHAAR